MYQIDLRPTLILVALTILQLVLYSIWGFYAVVGVPVMAVTIVLICIFFVEGFDIFGDIPVMWFNAVLSLNCTLVLGYHFVLRMEPVLRWLRIFFLLTLICCSGCKNSCVWVLTYERPVGNFDTSVTLRISDGNPEFGVKVQDKE